MNSGESAAGSSSSGRENGAALLDPERPHKKARFPWQIKGKHHLKNQKNEPTVSSNVTPEESKTVAAPIRPLRTEHIPRKTFQDILVPNILMPPNVNYLTGHPTDIPLDSDLPLPLETVISLAETMLLDSELDAAENESTSTQNLPGPSKPFNNAAREARRKKWEEEKCIARWQAAQTVKGCFDNTINRVLESWMNLPNHEELRLLGIDMARIMHEDFNLNDDNVENEGILMAINAHGLQSMSRPMIENAPVPTENTSPFNLESESHSSSEDLEILTERKSSSWPLDDRTNHFEEPTNDAPRRPHSEESVNYEPWRPVHELLNTDPESNFPTDYEDYDYEFMNTAVIQAIKSKGLMASGTEFS